MLEAGKKSVCNLLIYWRSQLHVQLSALFKQRMSESCCHVLSLLEVEKAKH